MNIQNAPHTSPLDCGRRQHQSHQHHQQHQSRQERPQPQRQPSAPSSEVASFSSSWTSETASSLPAKAEGPAELEQLPSPPLSGVSPKYWTRRKKMIAIVSLVLSLMILATATAVPLAIRKRGARASSRDPPVGQGPAGLTDPPGIQPPGGSAGLRIMPLGASITFGLRSSDGNGYRQDLMLLLRGAGRDRVTFVGSRRNGTMAQNAVEGWPGLRIDEVLSKASASVPRLLPNVILVNVGTNDCVQNWNINSTTRPSARSPDLTADPSYTIGTRMRAMVDSLLRWSPGATVVLSTLVVNKIPATQGRVQVANAYFRRVVLDMTAQGKKVLLADMSPAGGGPNLTTLVDVTHPNDYGYATMARQWFDALVRADAMGLITEPR